MKKQFLLTCLLFAGFLPFSFGQQYAFTSGFEDITKNLDTMNYTIPIVSNGWGSVEVAILFEGDFGDNSEFISVYANGNYIGMTQNYFDGTDCMIDSTKLYIDADSMYAWSTAGNIDFILITSFEVDQFCLVNHAQVRLTYHYCAFGTPTTAHFTSSGVSVCPHENAVALSAIPAGGTFSGSGVSGNQFIPSAALPGLNTITYTVTDGIGCVTFDELTMNVKPTPSIISDTVICPNQSLDFHLIPSMPALWSDNPVFTSPLDTTTLFTSPIMNSPETYYAQIYKDVDFFQITSMADTAAVVIDFELVIGDDRGGIAVTPDYIYFIGDDSIGRYDNDLTPASATTFPINDGIFSDLKSGALLSLYDGVSYPDYPSEYYVTMFHVLDENMIVTDSIILSDTIYMGNNITYSGIFAGYGLTILFSGNTEHYYAVDNSSGYVTDIGNTYSFHSIGSENWADWGIAEYDGSDYSIVYRSGTSNNIDRMNLSTGVESTVFLVSDMSDCATIGFSTSDNRWYFHYEYSGQFGGTNETGGYVNGTYTGYDLPGAGVGCYADVFVNMSTLNIGPSDTSFCVGNSLYLDAGAGFVSYDWSTGGNLQMITVDTAGVFDVEVVDSIGCTLTDVITVTIDSCTGINDPDAALINIFPNPASDVVNIEIPADLLSGNSILMIADAQGRIVLREELAGIENGFNYQLDVKSLDRGVYQLIITSAEKQFAYRLVRQ